MVAVVGFGWTAYAPKQNKGWNNPRDSHGRFVKKTTCSLCKEPIEGSFLVHYTKRHIYHDTTMMPDTLTVNGVVYRRIS